MTDETEKLAAQMRNLKPSKTSREAGLDAAMAAFDAEFATAPEEKSTSTQGSTAGSRPTGKTTKTVRATTRRVETMSKLNSIFQKPQAMMMAGTCGAALIAALVVLPNMDEFGFEEAAVPVVPVAVVSESEKSEVGAETSVSDTKDDEVVIVTGMRSELEKRLAETPDALEAISAQDIGTLPDQNLAEAMDSVIVPSAVQTPEPIGDITSVDQLLSEVQSRPATPEQEQVLKNYREVLQQKDNIELFVGQQEIFSTPRSPQIQGGLDNALSVAKNSRRTRIQTPLITKQADGYSFEEIPAEYKVETKEIVLKEAFTEFVETPPDFETVLETVVVEPASVELVEVPATYEWVDGNIEGSAIEYVVTPPVYETISEPVVVQEAMTELVSIPATYNPDGTIAVPPSVVERTIPSVTKVQTRRVVKTPASTVERIVPYEKRDGKTRVPVTPGRVIEKEIPAVTKQVERRVIRRTSTPIERTVPAGAKRKVQVRTEISPQKFYLRDDDGNIVREFDSRDAFEKYKLNTTTAVSETPVSTFSVDVDTASYSFLRASINRGQLPPRESIRLEEMINYFPYAYDAPKSAETPFKANVTVTPNPWNADTKLMHIGIKGYVPKQTEKPRSNLVFLIDTSGSMNQPNKLPLLVNSFKLLLNTLDEDDTVSIVAYASASGTVLEPTPVSKKSDILNALNNLRAGGSTAGAAGLELAYQKAKESFDDEGVNRVILATDGDFNVGFSSPDEMKDFIKEKRETGIFLSVLGFGMGNYNDHLMQSLAQNGNGVAAYIDTLSEANKVLANEAGSALFTIAKDVKIQVEFNPATVAEYRLIGYETRALKRQDFNNDKVDAGEIGAGHSVTAIYEMTPVGSPSITIDKLRYASEDDTHRNTGSDEYAFVKIRHKLPDADKSTLQTFPIGKRRERRLSRASDDMRFATAVSIVGQKLRGDMQVDDYSYAEAIKLANSAKGEDENGYRAEFIQMVKLIEAMGE
ncbi:MAG: von Willebrand factor type A domain-containing protein [Litorimonas sp.]